MLKIQRIADRDVVFAVVGELDADNLGELLTLLAEEPSAQALALDLRDLVLADRQAVRFLHECETRGIAIRNCPAYIRTWIASVEEKP
jgi:hypothetical protein